MVIVDSHCHVSSNWYEPVESLLFQMDRHGVAHAVLIQMQGRFDNSYQFDCVRRYPGRWEVAVADYNPEALLFWRSAVRSLGATDVAECPGDGRRWSGTVFCFSNSTASTGMAEAAD